MGHCRRKFSTPLHGGEKTGEAGRKRGFTTIGDDAHLQTDFPIWVNDQYRSIRSRREIYRGFEFHCMYIYIYIYSGNGNLVNKTTRGCDIVARFPRNRMREEMESIFGRCTTCFIVYVEPNFHDIKT